MVHSALLMIDVQQGFEDARWGSRNNPQAEQCMQALLQHWRECSWPVVHVRHSSLEPDSPLRPDQPGNAYMSFAAPIGSEPDFKKNVNSAFIGTSLESYLRDRKIESLVVAGLTTDHCVSTSVRMAANLGFAVTLVADATATFDRIGLDGEWIAAETLHQIHLASLHQEFCEVTTTAAVLENSHPR